MSYYFDRNFHGWFLKGETAYYSASMLGVSVSAYQLGSLGGYRWTRDSLSLGLGLGIQAIASGGKTETEARSVAKSGLYGMLHAGFNF